MSKILVVEDNKIVNKAITAQLKSNAFEVESVYTAEDALKVVQKTEFDLIILDLQLPQMSGYKFLQLIRQKTDVPVIVNTLHASVKARVNLIDAGANDFMKKSGDQEDLLESVNLLLNVHKKQKESDSEFLELYDLKIDFRNHKVSKNGTQLDLTNIEFDILRILIENPHKAFSREEIFAIAWGEEYDEFSNNTINVHIRRLRTKIEADVKNPQVIETVWKYGYRLGSNAVEMLSK